MFLDNTPRAKKERLKRLYKRIYNLLSSNLNNCLFITFTFTDKVLKSTNETTRERYIKAYLNEQTNEYILNRDYGKKNNREHYHAIATPKQNIFINKGEIKIYNAVRFNAYKYGQIKADRINKLKRFTKNNKTLEEIATDLMNHATKSSTKESKIIYSRPNKKRY